MTGVLAFLQRWAAYIWVAESIYGLLVCAKLLAWVSAGLKGELPPRARGALDVLARLGWVSASLFVLCTVVGVLSLAVLHVVPGWATFASLVTLVTLLAIPAALTWVLIKAVKLRSP